MKQLFTILLVLSTIWVFSQTATWQEQASGTTNGLRAIEFIDFQNAFAVGDNGVVLRTVDAGYHWVDISTTSTENFYDVCFVNSSIGWISGFDSQLYKTVDGGENWTPVGLPNTDTYNTVFCLDENTVWVGCESNQKIFYSTNQGTDWNEATAQGGKVNDIFFLDANKGWYASDVGIYSTEDGGATWNNQKYTGASVNANSICFVDALNGWYSTSDGKIWNTTDGGANWVQQNSGIGSTVQISTVHFIDVNIGIAVTQDQKIINTIDGGATWEVDDITSSVPLYDVEMLDENTIYAVGVDGKIYRKQQRQEICMVFVDQETGFNQIVWEKIEGQGTSLYRIYRLDGATFVQIQEQSADDMTEMIDFGSSPNVMSAQYKVSTVDALGNESELSPYHETINLSTSQGVPATTAVLQWNHYVDESGVYIPEYYYIYRGTEATNMTLYDQVSSANTSYNDEDGASPHYYKIVVEKEDPCIPESSNKSLNATGGPYYQSSSNIEDEGIVDGITNLNNISINISPNPTTGKIIIDSPQINKVEVYNLSGRLINVSLSKKLDLSNEDKGIYFIKVITNNNTSMHKIILE